MKRIYVIVLIAASLAVGIFLGSAVLGNGKGSDANMASSKAKQQYTCGMHPEIVSDEPGYCPICGMKLTPIRSDAAKDTKKSGERKIAYWVAPMDPTYIRNEPGKSPMGMDLVPVYEDEVSGSYITIDPVTSQNMGLKMAPVEKQKLNREINTVAHIDYNEENLFGINSKVQGWVEKLYVDYEGKAVRKGDLLLEIYSPDLVSAQQEYLSALKNYNQLKDASLASARKGAEDLLSAARDRLLLWDISQSQIDELARTGKATKTLTLYSPASGVVISKMVFEGDRVMPGMKLLQVADLSTVWAVAHVYEYELPFISKGQEAELSLSYLPGEKFTGRISFIYPYLDTKARDVEIRIVVPNRNNLLKPNMYATARIESALPGERLVIPDEAVIRSGTRNLVFISLGEGKFLPREITLGAEGQDGLVEVVSGLNTGDKVVTSSQFMLDSESRLREATSKIRAQMASTTVTDGQSSDVKVIAASSQHPEAEMKQMKMDMTQKEMKKDSSEMKMEMKSESEEKPEASSGIYTCPMDEHAHIVQYGPGKCPECGMKLVPAEETSGRSFYVCPMPQDSVVSSEPGKCPKCGMELVEKKIGVDKTVSDTSGHGEMKMESEALSGVYTCPMDSHAHVVQYGPGNCPECGMKLVPVEKTSGRTFYVCPMPQDSVVSSKPGKCPKCGMTLIERTVEGAEE